MIDYLFYESEISKLISDGQLISIGCQGVNCPAITQVVRIGLGNTLVYMYSNVELPYDTRSAWVVRVPFATDVRRHLRELLEEP